MTAQKQKRSRTYARNRATSVSRRGYEKIVESDGTYFLKLVVFILIGTFWIIFKQPVTWLGLPLNAVPIGMLVGFLLVSKFEKLQSDRKIWYAILIIVTLVSYFRPAGIVL
jgi:positive regulator of sigma E activity